VKSETSITLPLVEVDAIRLSVSWPLTESVVFANLPDVVKFKLLKDEADPVCAE
jgi:hypothetical protein